MILRSLPHSWALLFILRGSIVPIVAPRVIAVALLGAVVVLIDRRWPHVMPEFPLGGFALFGLALSVFLGFRNNACYDRWWEGRKQWGRLIIEMRGLAREAGALLGPRPVLLRLGIGYTHALCARLRKRDVVAAATPWLPPDAAAALPASPNPPDAILRAMNAELVAAWREGALTDILYRGLEARLTGLSEVQAACERIATTPLPFAYTCCCTGRPSCSACWCRSAWSAPWGWALPWWRRCWPTPSSAWMRWATSWKNPSARNPMTCRWMP
jgi:putative membrane protein